MIVKEEATKETAFGMYFIPRIPAHAITDRSANSPITASILNNMSRFHFFLARSALADLGLFLVVFY